MNLIGRYEKIRGLGPQGALTAPYILDHKWTRLKPFACDEWWRSPDGAWIPTIAGGIGASGRRSAQLAILATAPGPYNAAITTRDLNTAYTAGSGGRGQAMRYVAAGDETVTSLYFWINSYTGNPALVTDLRYELRTGTRLVPTTTAPGLLVGGAKDPGQATGWISITGLSQALSAGYVWYIIADHSGNGTNLCLPIVSFNNGLVAAWGGHWAAAVTDNGFQGATIYDMAATMVMGFSSGPAAGMPFSSVASSTTGTNKRGLRIGGFTNSIKIHGWLTGQTSSANINGIELFADAEPPNGTPLASSVYYTSTSGDINGAILAPSYTCAAATAYRAVFTYSSASLRPVVWSIGTGTDATLRSAMFGGGSWYYARAADAGTTWDLDDISGYPDVWLLIDDLGTPAGGGAPHLTGYGLAGG